MLRSSPLKTRLVSSWRILGAAVFLSAGIAGPAQADRIENKVAVFSALDKVTARISKLEVEIGKTITFGALRVTPRACYSRPPTEEPKTTTFVEVDETQLDGSEKRIFTGWMFAESPGIYGLEHPTYDVWLAECDKPKTTTASRPPPPPAPVATGEQPNDAYVPPSAQSPDAGPQDDGDIPPEFRRRLRR
ncbi:DUF2155 domain-containing protein [Hyphomicrobium methylovorum]|nr:DUF2155 domain-containing protein [Hyphomicrobium methylovorum]MBA2127478.1 DUF2155 domain-containing protein [Hyphomicrobium methylovorum]